MLGIIGVSSLAGTAVGAGVCYLWLKNSAQNRFGHIELEVKAKAKAIENEAELLLQESHVKIKAKELAQEGAFQKRIAQVEERNRSLILQTKELTKEEEKLALLQHKVIEKETNLEKLEIQKQEEIDQAIQKMQGVASFTREEAKTYILGKVEEQSRSEVAGIVRKYEQLAKEEGEKKANYILAQATTRYAGEFAGERLINLVNLPSDDHKGRIIGKEGRNIKTLEMLLGVDIIVDETPGVILV
ncbi:MAG: Rnase Y domain-containing protein, partial [Campylobacterota bacterium]|nr:Rnase Y domain-containing protein [Campylobacterota bacterium]